MAAGSSSKFAKESDSKRVEYVQVYKPKFSTTTTSSSKKKHPGSGIRFYHFIFIALYVYQSIWCISTIGVPYRKFLEKADREGIDIMIGTTKMKAELEYSLGDINDPNRRTKKLGWFSTFEYDYDIEQMAAEKKRDREQNVLDSLPKGMRVPSKNIPEFIPMLLFGIFITLHALVILMQHWLTSFNIWLNYTEIDIESITIPEKITDLVLEDYGLDDVNDLDSIMSPSIHGKKGSKSNSNKNNNCGNNNGVVDMSERFAITNPPSSYNLPSHARIIPDKGKHVLVPITYYPTIGMTFEYHRRRYYYNESTKTWTKIRCKTNFPLPFFDSWDGFNNIQQFISIQIRYGSNIFAVKQPTFMEMYKAQLLSPFTVFQLFCVILWMLDDMWQYSFFTLFMILMFEGTVVFSRIKSLQALTGMGNKPRIMFVYRLKKWIQVNSIDILPGDIVSVTRVKPHYQKQKEEEDKLTKLAKEMDTVAQTSKTSSTTTKKTSSTKSASKVIEDEGGDIVPADLLLLRGSTVVNEASLTGESVPQMKEGLVDLTDDEELSMKVKHKSHIMYAGTKMLQCKGLEQKDVVDSDDDDEKKLKNSYSDIPCPPDNGCICFVLRTGFSSAQGKLVRMIEGSQEKVKGHERETGLLLLLLFFFAVASSSYVLYHGLQNDNRSQYELLLHCILIITSVIPPELPMQMALAVNNSLMTLIKMQVFCTEPFRVPIAGKLNACLFDKTGTLTTDELVAVGVCTELKATNTSSTDDDNNKKKATDDNLVPMTKILNNESALVLAGCHSLINIDDETTGDPLESAALTSMRWCISPSTGHAIPADATEKKDPGKPIMGDTSGITNIEILARHHFSSKLQRMSTVIRVNGRSKNKHYAVAKGSPEAIGNLLKNKPDGYDVKSKQLSKEGYRVIALAYKVLSDNDGSITAAKDGRAACENDLVFAGFIAFTCRVRKDTAAVLRRLKEGGMSVTMVTGDALLTAAHVAREVEICEPINGSGSSSGSSNTGFDVSVGGAIIEEKNEELRALIEKRRAEKQEKISGNAGGMFSSSSKKNVDEKKKKKEFKPILILESDSSSNSMYWQSYENETKKQDYVANDVPTLSKSYDLAITGKNLSLAFEYDVETKKILGYFKIFARMSPDLKETVIECLHSVGSLCLMCGDGANDVGALKQADVGVALLTGFGDINVDKGDDGVSSSSSKKKKEGENGKQLTAIVPREKVAAMRALPVMLLKGQIRALGVNPDSYPDLVEKEDLVQLWVIKAREKAMKDHDKKNALAKNKAQKNELVADKQRRMMERVRELEEQGESWAQFKAMKEFMSEEMEDAKKKKASMAKARGVEGSAATLAAQFDDLETGELPMVKLGDASIAAPFTSKMPSIRSCVDIVRQGRCTLVSSIQMYQILALNCLISSYSLSVLYLDGIKYGDAQMTSMGMLMSVSFMSVSRSKPLDRLSSVRPLTSIFHPSLFISLLGQFAIHLVTMMMAVRSAKEHPSYEHEVDLDGTFKPSLFNSVVFLVSSVQQVTVFVVNLQGRPFMTGLTENRPLLWSLVATFILAFMFASESVPGLNKYFQLVPFPDEAFRDFILKILMADVGATFCFDRLMKLIFCPDILFASLKGTSMKDVFSLAKTVGIIGFIMYSFLGNDETWEELERLANETDLLNNETIVDSVNATTEGVVDAVKACVGAACNAVEDNIKEEF